MIVEVEKSRLVAAIFLQTTPIKSETSKLQLTPPVEKEKIACNNAAEGD